MTTSTGPISARSLVAFAGGNVAVYAFEARAQALEAMGDSMYEGPVKVVHTGR